ncbi:helix-turn-helix domain-containing protein [Acanthopleuribacter pedis]|uniref:Helix-turn-helix transcriptional regulator n=1 Tax=Acanthopleuribacter pedis TaxID=442870 RepID=A0A8J7U3J6_9BACT|nr:helix-turn-helix domain-containing protein [Acanthopleuribacter pedis]MBO1319697.1 helix-turn-helix transcriptional regulator [Acanthopleuribacter pedis]
MTKQTRLSAEQRRNSIIAAALPLFSYQGFNGTTTKQIAEKAGVSEALLYRHFPSKEHLFSEIQGGLCDQTHRFSEIIQSLEPSTSTLVNSVHFLLSVVFIGEQDAQLAETDPHLYIPRLITQSLLEDGTFARTFWDTHIELWTEKWEACVHASVAAGDMVDPGVDPVLRWWFTHHLAMSLRLVHLPPKPAVDYGFERAEILDQAARFSLRGFGLKDEAIKAHYNPAMLRFFTETLFGSA